MRIIRPLPAIEQAELITSGEVALLTETRLSTVKAWYLAGLLEDTYEPTETRLVRRYRRKDISKRINWIKKKKAEGKTLLAIKALLDG